MQGNANNTFEQPRSTGNYFVFNLTLSYRWGRQRRCWIHGITHPWTTRPVELKVQNSLDRRHQGFLQRRSLLHLLQMSPRWAQKPRYCHVRRTFSQWFAREGHSVPGQGWGLDWKVGRHARKGPEYQRELWQEIRQLVHAIQRNREFVHQWLLWIRDPWRPQEWQAEARVNYDQGDYDFAATW